MLTGSVKCHCQKGYKGLYCEKGMYVLCFVTGECSRFGQILFFDFYYFQYVGNEFLMMNQDLSVSRIVMSNIQS